MNSDVLAFKVQQLNIEQQQKNMRQKQRILNQLDDIEQRHSAIQNKEFDFLDADQIQDECLVTQIHETNQLRILEDYINKQPNITNLSQEDLEDEKYDHLLKFNVLNSDLITFNDYVSDHIKQNQKWEKNYEVRYNKMVTRLEHYEMTIYDDLNLIVDDLLQLEQDFAEQKHLNQLLIKKQSNDIAKIQPLIDKHVNAIEEQTTIIVRNCDLSVNSKVGILKQQLDMLKQQKLFNSDIQLNRQQDYKLTEYLSKCEYIIQQNRQALQQKTEKINSILNEIEYAVDIEIQKMQQQDEQVEQDVLDGIESIVIQFNKDVSYIAEKNTTMRKQFLQLVDNMVYGNSVFNKYKPKCFNQLGSK